MDNMIFNKNAPTPLHSQLYDILRQKIEEGEYIPHQMIPSENDISKEYEISRTTVRIVISKLVNEGLLYRIAGKGTFVSESKITASSIAQKGIREQLGELGYDTDTTVVERKIVPATRKYAEKLKVPVSAPLIVIVRVRYVNETPFSILTNYLSAERFPMLLDKNIEDEALCNILKDNYGIIAKFGEETLESVSASESEAELLEVPIGFHVLLTECILYDENSIPYEVSKVLFRGDRIKLKFKFDRM